MTGTKLSFVNQNSHDDIETCYRSAVSDQASSIFVPGNPVERTWQLAPAGTFSPESHLSTTEGLRAEMAVRDLVARSAYLLDQADIEGVLRLFTDDCVITHTHGTFSGASAIRAYYEQLFREVRHTFHLWSNVTVRLAGDLCRGRIAAYVHALLEMEDGTSCAKSGLIADEVVKTADEWRICARSVAIGVTTRLAPVGQP